MENEYKQEDIERILKDFNNIVKNNGCWILEKKVFGLKSVLDDIQKCFGINKTYS